MKQRRAEPATGGGVAGGANSSVQITRTDRAHPPSHSQSIYRSLSSSTIIGRLLYVSDLGNNRGSAPGHVYAINPGTGRVVWRFHDGKYHSVIAAAGRLIVAGAIHLYALKPE